MLEEVDKREENKEMCDLKMHSEESQTNRFFTNNVESPISPERKGNNEEMNKKEKMMFIKPAFVSNYDEGIISEAFSEDFQGENEPEKKEIQLAGGGESNQAVVLEKKLNEKRPNFYSKFKAKIGSFNVFKRNERRKEDFSLGYFEYLMYLVRKSMSCLKKSRKEKFLKECEKKLVEELDLISILLKIHEIEKIKLVVFNEEQLVLFDSISKPFFVGGEENIINSKEEIMISTSKKMAFMIDKKRRKSKCNEALKKVKNESRNSEVSKRILKLIENMD